MTAAELYTRLAERGLIAGSRTPPETAVWDANASPWYVQVLTGFSAWLAGVLLLAFIVTELWNSMAARESWGMLIAIGAVCCGAAALLFWFLGARSQFAAQFALAISVAGQFAMVVGIAEDSGARAASWTMLFVELVLILIMKNRLHRLLSTFGAVLAWALAMHIAMFDDTPWNPYFVNAPHGMDLFLAILLWLVVWGPVALAAWWLVKREASWIARGREALLGPVMQGLLAALSVAPFASHPSGLWFALGMHSNREVDAGWLALWPLMAVLLALLALALAFAVRNVALMGLAIVFGLLEVGCFYYSWGPTLLVKSIVMLALGGGLLFAARLVRKASI